MGAWIEILSGTIGGLGHLGSHPTMGAWIEIRKTVIDGITFDVAPHDGCVD